MKSLSVLVFCGLFAIYSAQYSVKVTLLYESLCPDSIEFISNQLAPYYYHLRDFMDLEFVPFGKSKSIQNGLQFTCQHGHMECAGNKIQSCALNSIWNKDLQMAFVACHMSSGDLSGYHCANKYEVDFAEIMYCASTNLGRQLQLQAERRTNEYKPTFVPTIIFNDRFDKSLQSKALRNFVGTVCELINHEAPVCSGKH